MTWIRRIANARARDGGEIAGPGVEVQVVAVLDVVVLGSWTAAEEEVAGAGQGVIVSGELLAWLDDAEEVGGLVADVEVLAVVFAAADDLEVEEGGCWGGGGGGCGGCWLG